MKGETNWGRRIGHGDDRFTTVFYDLSLSLNTLIKTVMGNTRNNLNVPNHWAVFYKSGHERAPVADDNFIKLVCVTFIGNKKSYKSFFFRYFFPSISRLAVKLLLAVFHHIGILDCLGITFPAGCIYVEVKPNRGRHRRLV